MLLERVVGSTAIIGLLASGDEGGGSPSPSAREEVWLAEEVLPSGLVWAIPPPLEADCFEGSTTARNENKFF